MRYGNGKLRVSREIVVAEMPSRRQCRRALAALAALSALALFTSHWRNSGAWTWASSDDGREGGDRRLGGGDGDANAAARPGEVGAPSAVAERGGLAAMPVTAAGDAAAAVAAVPVKELASVDGPDGVGGGRAGIDTVSAVHLFFYLWYGTPEAPTRVSSEAPPPVALGPWRLSHWDHSILPHWDERIRSKHVHDVRYVPPDDIGSTSMPLHGPYSSADPSVVRRQVCAGRIVIAVG